MSDYTHGAYGQIQTTGSKIASASESAICYIGTAPVHLTSDSSQYVNKPVVINNIAEARKKLGYSEDFASYTLCEAMYEHFVKNAVGPLVFINVLDPSKHLNDTEQSKSLTPENGTVTIQNGESIILDTVVVKSGTTTLVAGTDYTISYNFDKKTVIIKEKKSGALGTSALTITYKEIDASAVTNADVIGEDDGAGLYTGTFALNAVYQETKYIPSFVAAPGFSSIPEIHSALVSNSKDINGHWTAYLFTDLPIVTSSGTAITLDTAATWKAANGYNQENESVHFPMALDTDGMKVHLSTLAAVNFQKLLLAQEGIPYKTSSNTECATIENLYLGESSKNRVYDDTLINEKLCQYGIGSAAYVGGQWVLWGAHSADYDQDNATTVNVSETNRMMLYYISNDFQHRRSADIDKPMTYNDVESIVAEEQARLDALIKIGALIYGEVHLEAAEDDMSDLISGDFKFTFNVTTTPLAKSLTAIVNWTSEGFTAYFESFTSDAE